MELLEKQISRIEIYSGHIVHLVKDTVILPNGKEAPREVCLHNGAVAIVPLLDDGRVIVERQFRYPHSRVFLEIPAGKLDTPNEDIVEAAQRELREETGAVAKELIPLGKMIPSPAILSEVIYLFLARGLSFGERELDEDEFINLEFMPLSELYQRCMNDEISDAKTIVAVTRAVNYLK